MLETKVCAYCKQLYQATGNIDICPRCRRSNDTTFKYIKEYLQKYPGTSLPILSEKTGIEIPKIEEFLRQERIEVAPNSPVMLACSKCNAEIVTGIYCDTCGKQVANELRKIKNTLLAEEREGQNELQGKLKYVPAKWRTKK